MLKFFKSSYFSNCLENPVCMWYDAIYRPIVSFTYTPTHTYDLKVKVTAYEILCQSSILNFFRANILQTYGGFSHVCPKFHIEQYSAHVQDSKVKVTDFECHDYVFFRADI